MVFSLANLVLVLAHPETNVPITSKAARTDKSLMLMVSHNTQIRRRALPDHRGESCHLARQPHTRQHWLDCVEPPSARSRDPRGGLPGPALSSHSDRRDP